MVTINITGHASYISSTGYLSRDMTKPTKWLCAQWRLRSARASAQSGQSSLSAWRKLASLATHWAHSEDSDQIGHIPRLIWVFAGRILTLLVFSCRGLFNVDDHVYYDQRGTFLRQFYQGVTSLTTTGHVLKTTFSNHQQWRTFRRHLRWLECDNDQRRTFRRLRIIGLMP